MVDDYIWRKDAVKIAEKYGLANGSVLGRHTGLADCIASEIAALPTVDIDRPTKSQFKRMAIQMGYEQMKHGQWIIHIDPTTKLFANCKCSCCGHTAYDISNYCSNCGSKMEVIE